MSDGSEARCWLRPDVALRVTWRDRTPSGGPIGARIEHTLRDVFAPVLAAIDDGAEADGGRVLAALEQSVASPEFTILATVTTPAGSDAPAFEVRDEVLHPDPGLTTLHELVVVEPGGQQLDLRLPSGHWPLIHTLISDLCGRAGAAAQDPRRHPDMAAVLDALRDIGALTDRPLPESPAAACAGTTFAGHNTVVVRSDHHAVLLDPFVRPPAARYPDDYQPLTLAQLGPVDAVLLTHGHPDHFDPATLLRIPPSTPVVVPAVERESLLAPDLERRLIDLGFSDVRPRAWGAIERFGDVEVHVLPFFGEQPTAGRRLHPEVVNAGNTYVVRTPLQSAAFMADAGSDDRGNAIQAAASHRAEVGPVELVFAGYRGWVTTPAELLRSSVGRYLLFVPPESWAEVMTLMNDADGALDTAAAFGASRLVPYADGGAPWFWEIGLGPRLDEHPEERVGFDPFPERVVQRAEGRADVPVEVLVLRPGERVAVGGEVVRSAGHRWPWPPVLIPS